MARRLHWLAQQGVQAVYISNRIDQLIQSVNELKPLLSNNQDTSSKKFSNILEKSAQKLSIDDTILESEIVTADQKKNTEIPNWVDPDYGYDPENPRKPFMRELVEAVTGKTVEELYDDPDANWKVVFKETSSMLYGVVGANTDTRDWSKIMEEDDILSAARLETNKMYEPRIEIVSSFNDDDELTDQIAVLKDRNGTILSDVPKNLTLAEEILTDYGVQNSGIPINLESEIDLERFDNNLLNFLQNFNKYPKKLDQLALETTIENITNRLSAEIPLSEYDKL